MVFAMQMLDAPAEKSPEGKFRGSLPVFTGGG
jgi:hypothetical protein